MSKDVINVGGEEKVVREDAARSYRGTVWALLSIAAIVIIAAIIFFAFFSGSLTSGDIQSPKTIEGQRQPQR